jgi:D-serine deaminase-like pyridoxal phosphate-dependent protein
VATTPSDGASPVGAASRGADDLEPELLESLETPAVLIELDRLEANIHRWQAHMDACGVKLRPHIKTHKVPAIAELQRALGARGIAVAKVAEAEIFAAAGFDDIVIAFPVYGQTKWSRIAALAAGGVKMTINVESVSALEGLSDAALENATTISVQLDIDSGMGRGGLRPDADDAIESLARAALALPGISFEGLTTHRGMFFPGAEAMTREEAGREEGEIVVGVAERLRRRGIPVREVTAGGTITGFSVARVPGITEVRAGTYVFNDLMQVGFGSAEPSDIAISVIATVVSTDGLTRATIDAGSKTFSGDQGPVSSNGGAPGEVARAVDRMVGVDRITEEHGMLSTTEDPLALGDRLTFYPMHACTCVNLSDELYGIRDGRVECVWPVLARGKRT